MSSVAPPPVPPPAEDIEDPEPAGGHADGAGRAIGAIGGAPPPAGPLPWSSLAERWLRRSGVPAFVVGHARPAAVARRWPWILGIAVVVAAGVLLAIVIAGYGAALGSAWLQATLTCCSLLIGLAAVAVGVPEIGSHHPHRHRGGADHRRRRRDRHPPQQQGPAGGQPRPVHRHCHHS